MSTQLGTIIADFTTQLSTQLDPGGTSATLQSIVDDDGNTLPNGRYFFTLDGASSQKEHISATLTAGALSNIKSVSRQGVETVGAARQHRIGASVKITDFAHIKFINDLLQGLTGFDAAVPLGYDGAPTLSDPNSFATVQYVLDTVNGGTVSFDNQILAGVAGENLVVTDHVYFKESDQRWYKIDADTQSTIKDVKTGHSNGTASAGGACLIQVSGIARSFSGLTAGAKYYASNTPGAISTTPGTLSYFVGWALTATTLLMAPKLINTYVDSDQYSTGGTEQSQTTQNGGVEFGEANSTLRKNLIAQSFIPQKSKIRGVKLYKMADTGSFTGTVKFALQANSGASPSGSDLASVTFTNAHWLALSVGEIEALFTSEYASLTPGALYWIVMTAGTSDNSNHPNLGTNSAGGYSSGSVQYFNSTDSWNTVATIDLYFKTLEGINSQVVKTNSTGGIPDFNATKVTRYTASSVWQKPPGSALKGIYIYAVAGGASGGKAATSRGAGGGGGGAGFFGFIPAALLTQEYYTVTVGAGGAAQTSANTAGNAGGNTSFGSLVTVYGGGGGWGNNTTDGPGGSGGGLDSAGAVPPNGTTGIAGGGPSGGDASGVSPGKDSFFGGGGGSPAGQNPPTGGNSIYGGGGGGAGRSSGSGGPGGASKWGGGGGGGGGGSATIGGVSQFAGSGGGGGAGSSNGTDGTAPGGGGGGSQTGNSGAGARGEVIVIEFY